MPVRVLLDEQLPRRLARELTPHEVRTLQRKDGRVSRTANSCSVRPRADSPPSSADQNLQFQQNLSRSTIGVVVLVAQSNALEDLRPLVPGTVAALERVRDGEVIRVAA